MKIDLSNPASLASKLSQELSWPDAEEASLMLDLISGNEPINIQDIFSDEDLSWLEDL